MTIQAHIGEELVELFRDGKYSEAENVIGNHTDLLENREYLLDYFHIMESHMSPGAEDVRNHLLNVMNTVSLDAAVESWSKLCLAECSPYTFEATAPFILRNLPLIEKDEKLMDIFIYSLPYKLENRITTCLSDGGDLATALTEAVLVLQLYNSSVKLKFYKFPKLIRSLVCKILFQSNLDFDSFLAEADWRIAFHPALVHHKGGKFLPRVYTTYYLLEQVIDGLALYLQDFSEERHEVHYPSVISTLNFINDNMFKTFSVAKIQCLDNLLFNALPYIQDFTLEDTRKTILKLVDSIILRIDTVNQALILKHIAERAVQVNKRMEGDCLILAWVIDHYRKNLSSESFQNELASFWSYLENLRFEDIEAAAAYYSAVSNLALAQALLEIDKAMMANVKRRVLVPIQDQMRDYMRLQDLKKQSDPTYTSDNMMISDAQQIDLIVYNLNYSLTSVNRFLSS